MAKENEMTTYTKENLLEREIDEAVKNIQAASIKNCGNLDCKFLKEQIKKIAVKSDDGRNGMVIE
jgi:hypothetical protein